MKSYSTTYQNPMRRVGLRPRSNDEGSWNDLTRPIAFVVAHLPLGFALLNVPFLSVIHPLAAFGLGLYCAINKRFKMTAVAYTVAYIVGVEVLWRMAKSPIFWEFGKYSTIIVMSVALIQRGKWKLPTMTTGYFALLIPGAIYTVFTVGFSEARGDLSFNLSGPLMLTVACWFFSSLEISRANLQRLLLILTVPILSLAVTTLVTTASIANLEFINDSNAQTSGGFGPNQVSSILGLGVFTCGILIVLFSNKIYEWGYAICVGFILAIASMLTFSRGGVFNALGGIATGVLLQASDVRKGLGKAVLGIASVFVFIFFVFPYIDAFTGGALKKRFEDIGTSNRSEMIYADAQVFMDSPILGVGVGAGNKARLEYISRSGASHTEFTRLISEHGIFGIFALGFLIAGSLQVLAGVKFGFQKALVGACFVWSGLFMFNAGMRLAAPALMWGMGFVTITSPMRFRLQPKAKSRIRAR